MTEPFFLLYKVYFYPKTGDVWAARTREAQAVMFDYDVFPLTPRDNWSYVVTEFIDHVQYFLEKGLV